MDDPGVDGAHRLVVRAEPGQPAWFEILHQDVGPAGELAPGGEVVRVVKVQCDRSLVPVDRQGIGRHPVARGWGDPVPGVGAPRAPYLGYVCAGAGVGPRVVRACPTP